MIYGVDRFRNFEVSGFRGVHLSSLPISRNDDLFLDNQRSRSRLDRQLWSKHEFTFHESSWTHPLTISSYESAKGSSLSMHSFWWMVLTNSGFRVSRFPHSCEIRKGFKPRAHFPYLMVTRAHLPSRTDPKSPTLSVWSSFSLWTYTTLVVVS